MTAYPRREFLLSVLAACGTPWIATAGQASPVEPRPDPNVLAATTYFGAGVDAARAIGEAWLRQLQAEPTRPSILEHASMTLQMLASARNQKTALAQLVAAVRRDFQEGRVVVLEGWVVARTEAELCVLTLLPTV